MDKEVNNSESAKKRMQKAVIQGDSDSLFLDSDFVDANLPDTVVCHRVDILRSAVNADEQREMIEKVVSWFESEIIAMKIAENNMNWRYTKWRMDLANLKPRLKREYTDKRSGAVAWEAFDWETMVLRSRAYAELKFFSSPRYRCPPWVKDNKWERSLRLFLQYGI